MTLPNGPEESPLLQVKEWIEHPIDFWERCYQTYGDIFTVQLGSLGTIVVFSHPEAVKEIFTLSPVLFECHQYNDHYKYVMGEQSLLVQDGEPHKRQRRLLMPPLHQERIKDYAELMCTITREVINQWPLNQPFSVRRSMHEISLQVILKVVFGNPYRQLSQILAKIYTLQVIQEFGSWSPWSRFGRLHPQMRQLIAAEIERGRKSPNQESSAIFDLLLSAVDEAGKPLSDAEIQDHIFTFLVAGVDPTALALSWALYWIHATPSIREKLLQELAPLGENPDPMALIRLPYLTATCQEVLRMYPVVTTPSGRKLSTPKELMGYHFEAKTTLLVCTYLVHRREDLYSDPHTFKPERFLERQFTPYEYFPFGGGNRLCIGAALGMLELKLVLGTILSYWDLVSAHQDPVLPVRHGTLLAPSDNMQLLIKGQRTTANTLF